MKTRSKEIISLAFNKPYGVLSSFTGPAGRITLADYIRVPGVYAAGRLDFESEGLLVLTSNHRLSHYLTDPRHKLWKSYLVQVERIPDEAALDLLRSGVMIQRRQTRQARVEVLQDEPHLWARPVPIRFRKNVPTSWLKVEIQEGRNRQVRRMTAAVGYPTLRLVRMAIGPVLLGDLQPGQWRPLREQESLALQRE